MMSLWSLLSGNQGDHADAPPQDSEHVSISGSMPPTPKPIGSTKSTPSIVSGTPAQSPAVKEKEKLLSVTFIDGTILDYDEPYVGQGYPGGTSAANALVALIYGLKKTNFQRGAEATVQGDHVSWVDGTRDKSVKLVDIDFGAGGALIYVFLPETWVHKHCTTIGGSLSRGVVELFWSGFSEHPFICAVHTMSFRSHTYPKISLQLEHFDKFNCGSIILGVKGDIGSNLIAKYIGDKNRVAKVILLEGGDGGVPSGGRKWLPSVSITDLFQSDLRDGDVSELASLAPSQPYSVDTDGSAPHQRLLLRDGPERLYEYIPDGRTVALYKPPIIHQSRHLWDGALSNVDSLDQGGRQRYEDGPSSPEKAMSKGSTINPCNVYYLHPNGCQNDNCRYRHDLPLKPAYLKIMAYHGKRMACPWAMFDTCPLSAEDCPIGHVCPYGKLCTRGRSCMFGRIEGGHGDEGEEEQEDYDGYEGY